MSVRDLTNEDLLYRLRYDEYEADGKEEYVEITRRFAEPWTDAVLVEKVAQGLYEEATRYVRVWGAPEWRDLDEDYRAYWITEAAPRVLGEPSEATKLDDGEFGKAVARGGALRLRGSLHGESS